MATDNERGQVTILVIGLALVVMAVIGVAVDGTRAMLHRRMLQNAADAAALDAAATLDVGRVYAGRPAVIDPETAIRRALGSLQARGVDAEVIRRVGPDEVVIVLRGSIPTTFLAIAGIDRLDVAVEAAAAPLEGGRAFQELEP